MTVLLEYCKLSLGKDINVSLIKCETLLCTVVPSEEAVTINNFVTEGATLIYTHAFTTSHKSSHYL